MANDFKNWWDLHSSECDWCIPATKIKAPMSWTTHQQQAVWAILSWDDAPRTASVSKFPEWFDWASI